MATVNSPAVQGLVAPNGMAVLSLDRPKALNAMNLEMDVAYKQYLDDWSSNAAVKLVLVESTSSRAFSAGMDIKGLAAALRESDNTSLVHKVFQAEYSLICAIARYSKPYVSVMDGITMGFGIGLSGHGHYRVITERTVLAMPENGIGLFPDVGFAHLAARSPGEGSIGLYLATTGARISKPADALFAGLGTHFVPSQKLPALKESLLQRDFSIDPHEVVEDLLSKFSEEPKEESQLKRLLPVITSCFGGGKSVLESVDTLRKLQVSANAEVAEWAEGALAGIGKGAPFSLCLTQRHFLEVALAASDPGHDLAQIEGVMKQEHRLAVRMASRSDFVEGVRAVLIDKDQKPIWQPKSMAQVEASHVDGCFQPFDAAADELAL